jgi:uncharacterized protein YjbI with pentapeptide repeats
LEDYQCTQPLDSVRSTLCILHDPNANKDVDRFDRALREKLEREEAGYINIGEINLAGVEFPVDVDFSGRVFKKAVTFAEAEFRGDASFQGAQFSGDASFRDARFNGGAYFEGAHFSGPASFIGTEFPPEDSEAVVRFDGLASESARNLRLDGVDLSRASFLRTDVSLVHFVGCTWAKVSVSIP